MLFQGLVGDLLSAVCRQTVKHEGSGSRSSDQLFVDLKRRKLFETPRAFVFKPHAHPDIGVENFCPISPSGYIIRYDDLPVCQLLQEGSLGSVVLRSHNSKLEPKPLGGPDPGTRNIVVAIADETDRELVQASTLFQNSKKIGQDLARM